MEKNRIDGVNGLKEDCQTVTIGIIAYNEERYLPDLLQDVLNQEFQRKKSEIILVDGESEDNTWNIMQQFKENYREEFKSVKTIKNKKRVQPAGWNLVIQNSDCDVIMRIDAHARLPKNFVLKNMERINTGEDVCGGPRENIIDDDTRWKRLLLAAEQSMFGAGIASYRQKTEEIRYVNSLFHGAYKREVFETVGWFNENLIRTEDNEMHHRIREAGYRICYDPEIRSFYQTRNTLKGMLKQKFQNGRWIGKTMYVCPKCVSLFHLVPFVFVLATIVTAVLAIFGVIMPCILLWSAYGLANVSMTVMAFLGENSFGLYGLLLPLIFVALHYSYGIGTACGLLEKR